MIVIKRIGQFIFIYTLGLLLLWSIKKGLDLSDYLIPSVSGLYNQAVNNLPLYIRAVANTQAVAIAGHILAIGLATVIAMIGRLKSWIGSFTRIAAYNLQAYPIVAVAPIIFIFLGDGLSSRLLIATLICYFPLLLSFIGIFSEPIDEVEHFFRATGRITWQKELQIRTYENIDKLITVIIGSGTLAMVGTIIAEFLAATHGIGYVIRKALYESNLATILVCLFLIGLTSSLYLAILEELGKYIKKYMTGSSEIKIKNITS